MTSPVRWEFLLLPPQPPWVFSITGLRLYFPALEPWFAQSALLPAVCLVYLVLPATLPVRFSTTLSRPSGFICANVGPQGLLVVRLPALLVPHLSLIHI